VKTSPPPIVASFLETLLLHYINTESRQTAFNALQTILLKVAPDQRKTKGKRVSKPPTPTALLLNESSNKQKQLRTKHEPSDKIISLTREV
jgi:hypothetical protein